MVGIGATAVIGFEAAAAQSVRQLGIAGGDLAYVETGSGEPLVLIHGGLQDHRFWRGHMAGLGRTHRVIAYSRRNHFPNPVTAEGLPDGAADAHADDLLAFLNAAQIPKAHIAAHSAGAHAALFFASRFPARVSSLILNEPPAAGLLLDDSEGVSVSQAFSAALEPARAAFRAGQLEAGIRLFADVVGGAGAFERRSAADRQMMLDNVLAHVADAISSRSRARFTREMCGKINVPVLLTTGERSPPFFHAIADELERHLPDVRRARIANASHTVPTDNAAGFAVAAQAFLTER